MNYQELRDKFKSHLNRRDCTDSQADDFIDSAFLRINRVLDHYIREASFETTVTDPDGVISINLPLDCGKRVEEVYINGYPVEGRPERSSLTTYYLGYDRFGNTLVFNQILGQDTVVRVLYWRNFARPAVIADTNDLIEAMHPIILYGALAEAGEFFEHERTDKWTAKFDSLVQEANDEGAYRDTTGYGGTMTMDTPMGAAADY